ncbi:hypothetical protein DUI87_16003 [Hirundo rustica rustica]|uniref:Uncharacterized protein n=1 Tax=Hirundo rustica rustica TaxID=333673 RepID=A0A3M0K089_HIRRU|nr:hypothetical protein DUI87_16003 [Hirundo rustica rustica]
MDCSLLRTLVSRYSSDFLVELFNLSMLTNGRNGPKFLFSCYFRITNLDLKYLLPVFLQYVEKTKAEVLSELRQWCIAPGVLQALSGGTLAAQTDLVELEEFFHMQCEQRVLDRIKNLARVPKPSGDSEN